MGKLDYKKLWEQQKEQNIKIVSENVRLLKEVDKAGFKRNEFKALFEDEIKNANSWEQLRNMKAGEAEGIMRCFKELLKNKIQP